MGLQHAKTGVIAGCVFAELIPAAPGPTRALVVIVTGGASLLPDLDTPQATAARSLGPLTKGLAIAMDWLALRIYHATRGPRDTPDRISGHRAWTHTLPACALAGLLFAVLTVWSPLLAALACALLAGLLSLGLRFAGFWIFAVTFLMGWWALSVDFRWWWVVPVAVTIGCVVHTLGDWVTNSGVPLLWPLMRDGKRWGTVRAPATFDAGGTEETYMVRPVLLVTMVLALGWVTGLVPSMWLVFVEGSV